jgi:hypothetical protein
MLFRYVVLLGLLTLSSSLAAQLRYGVKAGLNFATFQGPSETGADGAELENYENLTGFHLGFSLGQNFTDNFGIRGELLYSKRGARYTYDGPTSRLFTYTGGTLPTTGTAAYRIKVNNSYMDVALLGFGRYEGFELSAGPYVGLLIQSFGEGSLRYNSPGIDPNELIFTLNHNYLRDDPGEADDDGQTLDARIGTRTLTVPKTQGAYYDYADDQGNYYNTLDYGLIGGLSYYFTSTLFMSGRVQYGLADLTNDDADYSRATGAPVAAGRDDVDRNFVLQLSVGFNF